MGWLFLVRCRASVLPGWGVSVWWWVVFENCIVDASISTNTRVFLVWFVFLFLQFL